MKEIIDAARHEANMYGCLPCPWCGGRYRWPRCKIDTTWEIVCDECDTPPVPADRR